jgi:hypothetical protein
LPRRIASGSRQPIEAPNAGPVFDNDLRIKQLENHDFIVPWQMVVPEKKEVLVE